MTSCGLFVVLVFHRGKENIRGKAVCVVILGAVCHSLKTYFTCNFKKLSLKEIIVCIVFALIGILITYCYSFAAVTNLFGNAYSSALSLAVNCVYLLAAALIEEMGWRGFLFRRISDEGNSAAAAVLVGVIRAIWHLPMWLIRNSLGVSEIMPLFIWTILVAVVLGILYHTFRNILSTALLHMIFNVCFLAPMIYNCIIIFLIIFVCLVFGKHKNTDDFTQFRECDQYRFLIKSGQNGQVGRNVVGEPTLVGGRVGAGVAWGAVP